MMWRLPWCTISTSLSASASSSCRSSGSSVAQLFQGGVAEPGDELEPALFQRLQVDLAAHAAIEDEDRLADLEAAAQDFDKALQGSGIGPVAAEHGEVKRDAARVGGHRQDDLGPVAAVIAAVAIFAEERGAVALEVNAGEIVEHQADGFFEGLAGQALFQGAPVAGERVHGRVEIIFVKAFLGAQAAGSGEQGAGGVFLESEFGAGEEEAGEDQGLEQGALARSADGGEEAIEAELLPGLDEDGEATEIEALAEGDLFLGDELLAGEGVGDELAHRRGQLGDIADGAGAGALGGAEGFAHQIGEVNFVAAAGFGDLDEHLLPIKQN